MEDEIVAVYNIGGVDYTVWAVKDEDGLTGYYDIYGPDSFCVNEGNPQWEKPNREDVEDMVKDL